MSRWRLLLAVALAAPPAAYPQGMPVGPEFRVNTYTPFGQSYAEVAFLPSGGFVVVWDSNLQDGADVGVFGQRFDSSGAPVGPEFRVNTHTSHSEAVPSVASDSAGSFVVAWGQQEKYGSNYSSIFAQRYAGSGAPLGSEFRVNTVTAGTHGFPDVVTVPSGDFIVVWGSTMGAGGFDILGQRYSASGAPVGGPFRVNTYTSGSQSAPDIGSDAAGNFTVVWESDGEDGSLFGVFGQRFSSAAAPLGPPFRVNTHTSNSQRTPAIAMQPGGGFVVAWTSAYQDGSGEGVFGQRYASGGAPLGPEFRVNTYTTSHQHKPSAAPDLSGSFVVVYDSYGPDGSLRGIFGQRYTSEGTPLGGEFQVNTYTTGTQTRGRVAVDAAGSFVVVWGTEQGPAFSDVHGQRYDAIVPVELFRFGVE